MPTLTQQQRDDLQAEITSNDIAGFYALLESYGDSYGTLGSAVTGNNTWQGELANAFAAYGAEDDSVDLSYQSTAWTELNKDVAQNYLTAYNTNNGTPPTRDQIQTAHNNAYVANGLDPDDWLPNKLLNDSGNPDALWADFMINEGGGDLIGDAWEIAKGNILTLTLPPLFATAAAADMEGLVAQAEYTDNLLNALFDLSTGAKTAMASDFTGTDIADLLDMLDSLPGGIGGFAAHIPAIIDDPGSLLEGVLPSWLGGALTPFDDAKTTGSPLVLDLDSDGVDLTTFNAASTTTFFDIDGDGFAEQTAWVSDDDGLLVRDLNENGTIDDVDELFGSPTIDGFALLAQMDTNGDLVIDASDADWGDLRIWQDANNDAVTQEGELLTLASLDIESISLLNVAASTSTISGNPISHTLFAADSASSASPRNHQARHLQIRERLLSLKGESLPPGLSPFRSSAHPLLRGHPATPRSGAALAAASRSRHAVLAGAAA